jgi:hypothetical protein
MKSTAYELPLLVLTGETKICEASKKNPDGSGYIEITGTIEAKAYDKKISDSKNQLISYKTFPGGIEQDDQKLHPYTTGVVWRKLPNAILINNKLVIRYQAPKIVEYLDLTTGEIINASALRHDPRVPPQIHIGEIQLLRESLLASLRKEVREFALFVLHFRNDRRGTSPEIATLVEWYALINKKRPSNVRRYVKALQEASFFAGESLISPLFQRTGKTLTSKDHLGEDAAARSMLMKIRLKMKSRSEVISNPA